jgi:hypothetical protein
VRSKLVVFIAIIMISLLSFGLIKEYKTVVGIKEQAGQRISFDVNLISNYVKSVRYAVSSDIPAKPMSEKKPVTKDDLLMLSAKANVYRMIAGNLQVVGALDGYFGVLNKKLYELSQIIDNPTKEKEIQRAKQEISVIAKTLDEGISLIQKAGEDNQGVNFQTWYKINTDVTFPKSIADLINQTEKEWGFLK